MEIASFQKMLEHYRGLAFDLLASFIFLLYVYENFLDLLSVILTIKGKLINFSDKEIWIETFVLVMVDQIP